MSYNHENTYWNNQGKFQKQYDYYYNKLVPPEGDADNSIGNLIRIVSKIYYRKFNDGDSYYDLVDDMPSLYDLTKIEGIDSRFIDRLETILSYDNDQDYEDFVDKAMRYVILKDKDNEVFNPNYYNIVRLGDYQNSFDHFIKFYLKDLSNFEDISETGRLLALSTKILARNIYYGDTYSDLVLDGGEGYSLKQFNDLGKEFIISLENILNCEKNYTKFINKVLRYIMLEHSNPTKIWNPITNRLVSITGQSGLKALEMLDCRVSYTPN